MATPEGKVKDKVKRVLKDFGIHYFMPMQNGFGVVGVSDIICCWKGWYLAIETKAPGKKANTTANQKNFLRQVQDNGGLALVIDDAEELRRILLDILAMRKEQSNAHQEESPGTPEEPDQQARLQEGVRAGSVEPGAEEVSSRAAEEEPGVAESRESIEGGR